MREKYEKISIFHIHKPMFFVFLHFLSQRHIFLSFAAPQIWSSLKEHKTPSVVVGRFNSRKGIEIPPCFDALPCRQTAQIKVRLLYGALWLYGFLFQGFWVCRPCKINTPFQHNFFARVTAIFIKIFGTPHIAEYSSRRTFAPLFSFCL